MTISAPRDANRIPTIIGVDSSDGVTPVVPYVDPTTHRLLVTGLGGTGSGPQGTQGTQGSLGPTGPQGTQGSIGLAGATGAQGPQGSQGSLGPTGATGSQGPQGSQGSIGPQGPQGSQGSQSTAGVQGTQGTQGSLGPTGATGPTGNQGTQGTQGSIGATGATGSQGLQGTQGSIGPQGSQGSQGSQSTAGVQGTQGTQGSLGPTGATGGTGYVAPRVTATGSTLSPAPNADNTDIFQLTAQAGTAGFTGPAGSPFNGQKMQIEVLATGSDRNITWGNGYTAGPIALPSVATLAKKLTVGFEYDTSNALNTWLCIASTVATPGATGPTGAQGAQGTQGSIGPQGSQGTQGSLGPTGAQGATGNQGAQGTQGSIGVPGPQGTQGTQGSLGPTGATGAQGLQGTQGSQGSLGPTGATGTQGLQGTQGSQGSLGATGATGAQGSTGPKGTQGSQGSIGATGSQGPQGTQGSIGPQGPTGPGGTGGSGKRFSTLTIGASDAKDTTAADYDYICDGTDDDVQILAAIAALPSEGGRILLSEGTFNTGAAIVLNLSNIILEGMGASTLIKLENSKNVDVIQLGDGTNSYSSIKVINLKVDGNQSNQTTDGFGIRVRRKASLYVVENNWVQETLKANIVDDNLSVDGSIKGIVKNNHLMGTSGNGWSNIEGGSTGTLIEGNICSAGDYANIDIYNGGIGVLIVNNICLDSTGQGIKNEGSNSVIIKNNFIRNAALSYIWDTIGGGTIAENYCLATANPGSQIIRISGQNNKTTGNTIWVSDGITTAVTGISCSSTYNVISNNFIRFQDGNYAHIGIVITSTDIKVNDNWILNNSETIGGNGMIGISFASEINVVATGNYINAFDTGILASGSATCSITGGFSYNCGSGIEIGASNGLAIVGNAIAGAVNAIISSSDFYTTRMTITGNTFDFITHDTLLLRSVRYSTITGNTFEIGFKTAANTYSNILFKTISGTNYAAYNIVNGNTFKYGGNNNSQYCIRENSVNDGPNIITSNVALGATTAQISTQNTGTQLGLNLTS